MVLPFILTAEQRSRLLVTVISGGRPTLKERCTANFLSPLYAAGFTNVVWIVNDEDAEQYERDIYPFVTYSRAWAYDYAHQHWLLPQPPKLNDFLGAFPGREWACREAERRNCWGVLQLDDNITKLSIGRSTRASTQAAADLGGLAWFADILGACTLATNGRMVGCQMGQIPTIGKSQLVIARTGFPYSLFVEQVGTNREEWYGPFEDDITHAYQYGTRSDGATTVVIPLISYTKTHHNKSSGMRDHYDHSRSVSLQRIFPETAMINIRRTTSGGNGKPRIFHTMLAGAIRNKLTVHDSNLYQQVKTRIEEGLILYRDLSKQSIREKVISRSARAAKT